MWYVYDILLCLNPSRNLSVIMCNDIHALYAVFVISNQDKFD